MTLGASPAASDGAVRFATVIDATAVPARPTSAAAGQAAALAAFVREGLKGELAGETIVFYGDDVERDRLVELAPTREVRLVKMRTHRTELVARVLAAVTAAGGVELVLAAGGPAGAELATRLACHTGGAALTGALDLEVVGGRLLGRANVYSAHLRGRFELTARPWFVSLDPSWSDALGSSQGEPRDHVILSEADETAGSDDASEAAPFDDPEVLEAPPAGNFAASRFLVVAGYGAGDRRRLERIALAARHMGADFGVSRPVVMNAWAPTDRLIGVSGSRAAPALCLVVGASGAPALYWGIERAGFVVAINPDEHAPIARNADVVVRDDDVAVIEALAELIARRGD